MQRKTRQLWRIFAYISLSYRKVSKFSDERRVALILHCYAVRGGLVASSRPMDRTVARPTREIIAKSWREVPDTPRQLFTMQSQAKSDAKGKITPDAECNRRFPE